MGNDVIQHGGVHAGNSKPVYGFSQPANGSFSGIRSESMSKAPKARKVEGYMRTVLASNIAALMDTHATFKRIAKITERQKVLASQAGTSLSTVQRIMKKQVGPSSDIIEQIAGVLDVAVYQLMLPNLDPTNPQVVSGASAAERAFYQRMKRHHLTDLAEGKTAPKTRTKKSTEDHQA